MPLRRRFVRIAVCALPASLVLAVAGCASRQNALDPHSEASHEIAALWWWMLAGSAVVFAVVVMLIVVALVRRHAARPPDGGDRRWKGLVFFWGIALPIAVMATLFALMLRTLPATSAPEAGSAKYAVRIVGKQWFWVARYPNGAVTANEIHIPARTPVKVTVQTADVIHSFWVPTLNRKIDLIPGKRNSILLDADRVGVYRGQCAEYCGLQHANMAFTIHADPRARFDRWVAQQAKPARAPTTAGERRGLRVFLTYGCAACHAIRGTSANAHVGPDLTHVASRGTLAALTIRNSSAYLRAWIRDPQHVKPGNKMPALALTGGQLDAVVSYLRSLR